MASQMWLKRVLIPFWIVQLIFVTILLVLFTFSLAVVRDYQEDYADSYGVGRISKPAYRAFNGVAAVYIALCALTIIFDLTEIILLARKRLSPTVVVTFNSILTLVWAVVLILQIVGTAAGARASALGFIFIIVVLATSLGKLIYSSVILHRYRIGQFATRGTYSSPANAEAGVAFDPTPSGPDTAYNPVPAPLNPFRDASRDPSPAAGIHHPTSGAAAAYYHTAPAHDMQQTVVR
ncbi:hypothetical protein CKM354_001279600 [Cercospora kikuchii]|uniref:Uncharacterized protein n=1 Tax=Cercospora kikuchii TaxID=84275 RepID=A0A9P3FMM6_9PEZI|nr:uncharacterized protein CKM354_001279600 [Cercospora kikuchii]GIZ49769.1 hypothetical protein CKM354_001279600 [Cercospora kikuchii]